MSGSEGIFRRIQMLFGRGRVTHVDDSGTVQVMQVQMNGLEVPDNRLRLMEFGFSSNPPVGSDVLALHMAGDRSAGAVVSTNNQQARPRGLLSGETMIYSEDGKFVYLTEAGGISVFANGQPVNVTGATTVTINASTEVLMNTPLLKVSGDIIDNFGTNPHSMAQMRSIYDTHTHPVTGIQTGSSTVTSNVPNQTE